MRVKCILSRLVLVLEVVEESEIGDDWTLELALREGSCAAAG